MKRASVLFFALGRAALWCALCAALPVFAHHSFAMYDATRVLTVKGTVKEFQWTNPHAILWLVEDPAPGQEPQLWTVELPTSPGNLVRLGWNKRSLKAGDKVAVELRPLRSGKHGGSFRKVTLEGGAVLTATQPDPPAASGTKP
jgi:hypothetical protein